MMLYVLSFIALLDGQTRETVPLDVVSTRAECERLGHLMDGQVDQLARERFGPRATGATICTRESQERATEIGRKLIHH